MPRLDWINWDNYLVKILNYKEEFIFFFAHNKTATVQSQADPSQFKEYKINGTQVKTISIKYTTEAHQFPGWMIGL